MSLIICSIIIGKQLYHLRHTDTGVDRENVVTIPYSTSMSNYTAFKHEIEAIPWVLQAATAQYALYKGYNAYTANRPGSDKQIGLSALAVDNDFISLTGYNGDKNRLRCPTCMIADTS